MWMNTHACQEEEERGPQQLQRERNVVTPYSSATLFFFTQAKSTEIQKFFSINYCLSRDRCMFAAIVRGRIMSSVWVPYCSLQCCCAGGGTGRHLPPSCKIMLLRLKKSIFARYVLLRFLLPEDQWTSAFPDIHIVIDLIFVTLESSKEICPVARSPLEKVLLSFRALKLRLKSLKIFSNIVQPPTSQFKS